MTVPVADPEPEHCHAGSDGECKSERCPQIRDGEPPTTGRHCPLDIESAKWLERNGYEY